MVSVGGSAISLQVDHKRCENCSAGCVMRALGTAGNAPVSISIEHLSVPIRQFSSGERVVIAFSSGLLLGLASAVYLVPLLVMLLFSIGSSVAAPESDVLTLFATVVGLITGLLGSILLVRCLEARAKRSLVITPLSN